MMKPVVPKKRKMVNLPIVEKVKKKKECKTDLVVFGTNDVGQLGLPEEIEEQKIPVRHTDMHNIEYSEVATGGMHTVCLTENGRVVTFGCNDEGALGRETQGNSDEEFRPRYVDFPGLGDLTKIIKVTAGDSHSAALTNDGRVFIWGNFRGLNGALGLINPKEKCLFPKEINIASNIVAISSGCDHIVMLSDQGAAYSMGCADVGQIGRITKRSVDGGRFGLKLLLTPGQIYLAKKIKSIFCGAYCSFFLTHSGKVFACGLNNYNQLGIKGNRNNAIYFPVVVPGFNSKKTWTKICSGQHHTIALDTDGNVYAMGYKMYGRLGLKENMTPEESAEPVVEPTLIPALKRIQDISAGNTCSFALNSQGHLFSWGQGTGYLLGHNLEDDEYIPRLIDSLIPEYKVEKVACGSQHTVAIVMRKKRIGADDDENELSSE